MLIVSSNRSPDRLEVEPLDDDYNRVRLVVGTLDVTAPRVENSYDGSVCESLSRWFLALDRCWRGWTGTKEWSSFGRDFTLSAVHDGLGTVTLTAQLMDQRPENWIATGHLYLDGGGFRALAEQGS